MATDLANSRREYRQREHEIAALKTEIARLRVATGAPVRPDEHVTADNAREGRGDQLGARRAQHEHTIVSGSNAALVQQRGMTALKDENGSLRLELDASATARKHGRPRARPGSC